MSSSNYVPASPASNTRPIIFLGLDGAEPKLLIKWMAEGLLPNIASIYNQGLSGKIEVLPGLGDGATWPTLLSGVNPGRHGRYFRRQFKPGSYKKKLYALETDMLYEPFWSELTKVGKKVAILDLPYCKIENDSSSLQITNWLVHDRYSDPSSYPASFAEEILREFGDDPLGGDSDRGGRDADSLAKLTDMLLLRIEMKEKMLLKTLQGKQRDLVMTSFNEPHDIGHMCWHYHDPCDPNHDVEWVRKHGDPIKRVYMRIDEAIGKIFKCVGEDTLVMLFAGLGMEPNITANGVLDQVLARIDGIQSPRKRKILYGARRRGHPEVALKIARKLDSYYRMYMTSRRHFFATEHNENSGAIRFNLKGREPLGKISPQMFDTVCDTLIRKLLNIKNSETGGPLVKKVIKVRQSYHGERLAWLPDLMVCWDRRAPLNAIESPEIGRIEGIHSWGRTGDHSASAMLMLRGRGIKPGQLEKPPSIVDIPVTIASMLGVTLTGLDGHAFSVT